MKLEEYQNALKELDDKFGKKSSKTIIKVIDMSMQQILEKIDNTLDNRFNEFETKVHKEINNVHKEINSMIFKIAGLFSVIIALVAGIVTIIRFLPDLF